MTSEELFDDYYKEEEAPPEGSFLPFTLYNHLLNERLMPREVIRPNGVTYGEWDPEVL